MRYKNRQSQRIDVSWFLELEEKLGLIGKITLMFPLPWQTGEDLVHICFSRNEILALMLVLFRKIRLFSFRDGDPSDVTPFP
jgi:hypothetical protein